MTPSGTVGEAKLADINVLRVWLTTANPGYACGPTKYQNAKSKVSILYTILYSVYDVVFWSSADIDLNNGVHFFFSWSTVEVANGFSCPAAGELLASVGSFSRHAHPDDCRKYYICMEGTPREYGCPIGTVFKIGDSDGSGSCENPEDVPGWYANTAYLL